MVDRRWRAACKSENQSCVDDVVPFLPTDSELASAFADRRRRYDLTFKVLLVWPF